MNKVFYSDDFPDMLIQHMAVGQMYNTFAGVIKVSVSTLNKWCKEHPELQEAREIGEAACLAQWERYGLAGLNGKTKVFREQTYKLFMAQLFQWHDKQQVQIDANATIQHQVRVLLPSNGYESVVNGFTPLVTQEQLLLESKEALPIEGELLDEDGSDVGVQFNSTDSI